MLFGEKIRDLRKKNNLSQEELAARLGVTRRSILNYENKSIYPKNSAVIGKMAELFEVSADWLLSDRGILPEAAAVLESAEEEEKQQVKRIIDNTAALFAGGSLSEEDKLAFVHQIQKIYFDSKNDKD